MRQNNTLLDNFRVMEYPENFNTTQIPSHRDGNNGQFWIRCSGVRLLCVASDGEKWDHVSVSYGGDSRKTPTWKQMCFVKEIFFEPSEWVIQFHPARDKNISVHHFCLHMWRHQTIDIPHPEARFVA